MDVNKLSFAFSSHEMFLYVTLKDMCYVESKFFFLI